MLAHCSLSVLFHSLMYVCFCACSTYVYISIIIISECPKIYNAYMLIFKRVADKTGKPYEAKQRPKQKKDPDQVDVITAPMVWFCSIFGKTKNRCVVCVCVCRVYVYVCVCVCVCVCICVCWFQHCLFHVFILFVCNVACK